MKSFFFFAAIVAPITLLLSCGQQTSNKETGGFRFGIDCRNDTLWVNSSRIGSHTLSYSISGKPFKSKGFSSSISLDLIQLIKDDDTNLNDYAYTIATTGSLPIHFTIGTRLDTVIHVPFVLGATKGDSSTKIVSGPCLRLSLKSVSNSQESSIKKWLFNQGTYADEETIRKMAEVINILTASSFNEYVPEEDKEIPIIASFKGAQYKISTSIKSDYYYLFAATDYTEINDFIAEVVSQDFAHAETSSSSLFSCFRPSDKGGLLTMFFIAINKDWSRTVIPVGLVLIDNIKPTVSADNTLSGDLDIRAILSKGKSSDSEPTRTLLIRELNDLIFYPTHIPIITGHVDISTGQFRGDNAQFSITFNGDVESMTIKREIHRSYSWLSPGTKTISFSGQSSPIHFTYALDLGIGDNYIPITIRDKRGNETSCSYHIEMVQVEKTNPEINIDNNIDIWN